jgi:sec-independent protein translocase protein TatA
MQLGAVGIQEMWPLLLIVLVLFGAKRIPELFRGLGEGMKEFKKATRDLAEDESPAPPPVRRDDPASSA